MVIQRRDSGPVHMRANARDDSIRGVVRLARRRGRSSGSRRDTHALCRSRKRQQRAAGGRARTE
eukprot:scaffold62887_cov57-Phaeocystis_antarctica.AAC.2